MISQRDITAGKVLVSIAAVIENRECKILLIWEGDLPYHDWWVLPGGYVKPDETVQEAVKREVREETGLEIVTDRLIGIYDDFVAHEDRDGPIHHIIIAFKARVICGEAVVTPESREYAWMNIEEVAKSPRIPEVFKRILGDFKKKRIGKIRSRLEGIFLDVTFAGSVEVACMSYLRSS